MPKRTRKRVLFDIKCAISGFDYHSSVASYHTTVVSLKDRLAHLNDNSCYALK